ncbi:MAG TPA: GntG family PLP-dependent aldolase [candidate division Zixibacteria bacterium]|nr:aminotransferase class I/II-fold pyridoxal phosphate-dependent enzyme [candidate division Zixibacteria bacterium]MDD4917102.1 GntG family PLP-dependent aldolase [candidate division Zixibacteria bacterium]MDM7972714.1 GntG family PLP-dependent aldolase [candidate division Zixibacteria bacterium]HOD65328.1 GntG family PLP-dependent aldolase [candidate division Zixibacteria bacterium]HPM36191.1 GntG family PLP-dependent aldolase [candidate division Zixibacteria bacterium]
MRKIIDLRSDTVTRPVPAMRAAMAAAEVGDDVFGDDPTVNELQRTVADLFGKEAALYVPSGTMGNQIALKAQTRRGWELLCDRECHIVNYEVAGPVVHSGLLVNLIPTEYGLLTAEVVRSHIRPVNLHTPRTKVVALENTHNRHGGTILPQDEILRVREVCDEFGLVFHLDGARIWHVHVATGRPLAELVAPFDSVSVCLSKGLGAPVGSLVLGSAALIDVCRRERKLFGGGMRQAGIVAAGGLYAVRHHIGRLAEDHANARYLAAALNEFKLFSVDLARVQTNIVLADINGAETSDSVLARMNEVGVWAIAFGLKRIRLVTHLDVPRADCEEAVARLRTILV